MDDMAKIINKLRDCVTHLCFNAFLSFKQKESHHGKKSIKKRQETSNL